MEIIGTCKLCLEKRELRNSHLLPKAGYRLVRKSQNGEAPIVIKPRVSIQKDEQVRGHVFCGECEQSFSRGGEAWVLKNCYRGDKQFALKSVLDVAKPVFENGELLTVYAAANIAEIDVKKIAYFAASVFWKASVYRWKSAGYELNLPKMGRKYDEEFRQYLLHAGDFPSNATLWMSIINEERLWGSFFFPYGGREDGYYRNHFQFMGLTFDLFLGRLVPKEIRRLCLAHTAERFIAMSATADEMVATHSSRLARKSKPMGRLVK